jgi:hypothetical protein
MVDARDETPSRDPVDLVGMNAELPGEVLARLSDMDGVG